MRRLMLSEEGDMKAWKLVADVTVDEETRSVIIQDLPNLDDLFIVQNVSCEESANKAETVYLNNQPVIGSLPFVKNKGYFGWATILITSIAGYRTAEAVYSDMTVTAPGAINGNFSYNSVDKVYSLPAIKQSEKILSLKIECTDKDVKFAVGSSFKIWGR